VVGSDLFEREGVGAASTKDERDGRRPAQHLFKSRGWARLRHPLSKIKTTPKQKYAVLLSLPYPLTGLSQ
jgi:hypothetical protein